MPLAEEREWIYQLRCGKDFLKANVYKNKKNPWKYIGIQSVLGTEPASDDGGEDE